MKSKMNKIILTGFIFSILSISGCAGMAGHNGWTRNVKTPDVEWVLDWKAGEIPIAIIMSPNFSREDRMSARVSRVKLDLSGNVRVLSDNLMKFSPSGENTGEISWSGPSANSAIIPMDMDIDSKNNIYMLGISGSSPDFDPGSGVATENSTKSQITTCLVKIDPEGNYIWGHSWPGTDSKHYGKGPLSVCCDEKDNCYVTSDFLGAPGSANEGAGTFVAKYSPDGREKWRFKWELYPLNIIAGNDSLYLIGQFFDKTDFDPGKGEDYIDLTSAGFLSKFTSDGKYVGTRPFPSYMMVTNINSIALDSKGNLLIGGGESVNPRNGKDSREYCGVLYKLDPDANDIWSRRWAGGGVGCYVTCISVDNNDNIFVGGTLSFGQTMWGTGNPDMDPSEKWDSHRIHKDDIYLSKFNSDGNFMWSGTWGNEKMEWVRSIANDGNGGIYMLGSFDGSVDFDPGPGKSIIDGKGLEAFLLKLQE